jgi:NTP pyrophosphatase (non-canonical NTP hydrolase)
MADDLDNLRDHLRAFAAARDWEQFHTPKNLVMALSGEVGELTEIFQWLTPEESATVITRSSARAEHVREELADIFGYLLRLADVLDVDLVSALASKIEANARRYPVDQSRGSARKYTEFDQ